MESRSFHQWGSILNESQVKPLPPASVWLRSNYPDRLIVIGSVSGNRYEFPRGGATLEVDERDVPEMLQKMYGGNSCCGSNAKPTPKFTVI